MPTEIRRLVFTNDEAYSALMTAAKKADMSLPVGLITSASFKRFGETEVQLEFHDSRNDRRTTANYESSFVGSALILYCIHEHIPIPRAASKALDITGNNLSLVLRLDRENSEGPFALTG